MTTPFFPRNFSQRVHETRPAAPGLYCQPAPEPELAADPVGLPTPYRYEPHALVAHPQQRFLAALDQDLAEIGVGSVFRDAAHVVEEFFPYRVRRSKDAHVRGFCAAWSFQSPQKPLPFPSLSFTFFPRIEPYQWVARAAGPKIIFSPLFPASALMIRHGPTWLGDDPKASQPLANHEAFIPLSDQFHAREGRDERQSSRPRFGRYATFAPAASMTPE